jgi:predicted Abi (CAAX) family protease
LKILTTGVITLIAPGILEEVIFRVAVLPTSAGIAPLSLAWLLFVVYHVDWTHPALHADPRFLLQAAALGLACTAAYVWSGGSLWAPAIVHWVPVWVWIAALGGEEAHARGSFDEKEAGAAR